MKLTQKKTCFGCKALKYAPDNKNHCYLGYITGWVGENKDTVPLERCPKPMTKDDWNTAQTELRKGATLGVWLKDKPITLTFSHQDVLLLERGMRLLRWNSLEANNEDKPLIPEADEIIKRLQEVI